MSSSAWATTARAREEDRLAVQLLERRGILDTACEERLETTIRRCEPLCTASLASSAAEQRQGTASRFRAWLIDWCTTASAGLLRYRYRACLGLDDVAVVEKYPPAL